jgi:hypothetical protein
MAKLPTVVSSLPQDLKAFINQVREALDGRNGDRLLTVDDLVRSGVVVPGPGNTVLPPPGLVGTPSTPRNVQASGAIQNIVVTWDDPLYNGHSHAEVWGSSTNDLGVAVKVGMTPGAIFVDAVGPSVIRYYWVRFVNVLGVQGAFNAVAGVQGVTGSDVAYLLDTLTDAALDPDSDYSKFAVRADFFYVMPSPDFSQEATPTATATGDIWYQPSTEITRTWTGSTWGPFSQTLPFVVNSSPQTINGVSVPAGVYMDAAFIKNGTITNAKIGNAAIDDAKIANLSAGKITAGDISVGNYIQSTGFISGSQGWRINGNGVAEFSAASIRGQLTAAQIDSRGLSIKDLSGNIILAAGSPLATSNISGLGALATQNTVSATTQVTGLGGFAYLSTITSANISTYIASAAIGTAYISDLNATKLTSGSISVGTTISGNYSPGSTGWYIDGNGNAEFNQITVRSGQVSGALLRATAVPLFYSGVSYVINASVSTDPNAVYLRFIVSGSPVYVPHIPIWTGTVPAPETAAHRIASSVSISALNNTGGAAKDMTLLLVVPYVTAFETFVDQGGNTITRRVIQFGSDIIASAGTTGVFSFALSSAGSTSGTYSTSQPAAILVGGNSANNTIGNVSGLFWGIR